MASTAFDVRSEEGLSRMIDAALGGDAEALHRMAVLAGCGAGIPLNWPAAFEALRRAAARGHSLAKAELALLSRFDPAALLAAAPAHALRESPRIRACPAFLDAALCDWIVERARPRMEQARTYDARLVDGLVSDARTNTFTDFDIMATDVVLALVRARVAATVGVDSRGFEHTAVLHYAPGERFAPHYDYLDPGMPAFAANIAEQGQRVATFLVYLNDDFEDGETAFPQLGFSHRGAKGDALFFFNVDATGAPDTRTLHEGRAPAAGEKWLLSQFIRSR